jgi:hypothetical protein
MASKLPRSKIRDLTTTVNSEVFMCAGGPTVWATVEICYASEGAEPHVTIKVPVPVIAMQSDTQRRDEALRRARKLIDHVCAAIELDPEPRIPEIIEGIAEELGLMAPTTAPRRVSRG